MSTQYEKHKEKIKQWNTTHPEQMKAARDRYYENNKEKVLARHRQWKDKNRERIREYNLKYNRAHPEKPRAHSRKRRADQSETIIDLTPQQEFEILSTGCLFCHTHTDLVVAHDTPVSKGGHTTRGNLFCLCRACNSSMKKKSLKETIRQRILPLPL